MEDGTFTLLKQLSRNLKIKDKDNQQSLLLQQI